MSSRFNVFACRRLRRYNCFLAAFRLFNVEDLFDTFGGFSTDAVAFIAQTGKAARGDVVESQYFVDGLTNEIAVAIQRGNAMCVLNCLQEAVQVVTDSSDEEKSVSL